MRLKPTKEQSVALQETTEQFTAVFNLVCQVGWQHREGNAYTLHHLSYQDGRSSYPGLNANLHIQARQKASEAVKSALTRSKQGRKVSCPRAACCPPRYNARTSSLSWHQRTVNLSTTAGRQVICFQLPDYAHYAIGFPCATADLVNKRGKWYLHIVVSLPDIAFEENGQAIGVDLGVTHPAVTSDNHFLGKRPWREVEKRTFRLRRALQSNGSHSAKRHMQRLAGRQQRFRRDCDHVLSACLLRYVSPGTTLVVENLTHIRKRVKARRGEAKRRLHSWSFAQLRAFLSYKAEAQGCRVVGIDPRHTSQRCSRCGFIYHGNRPGQSRFHCRSCGFQLNADLNAARSIRDKHLVGWAKGSSDGLSSTSLSSSGSL